MEATVQRVVASVPVGARLGLRAQGIQPTTNAGTSDAALVLDPYVLADASVWIERRIGSHSIRLALDVHNLFDRRVLAGGNSGGFFPAAPRFAFASLRWTL